jgi:hypothetical protein
MGSGHADLQVKGVVSPGPVYDTRHTSGRGDATKAGLPTFKFGTGSRSGNSKSGQAPGPGHYSPNVMAQKRAPPR